MCRNYICYQQLNLKSPLTSRQKFSLSLSLTHTELFLSFIITLIPMLQSIINFLTILSPCYHIILNKCFNTLDNVHFISRKFSDKPLDGRCLTEDILLFQLHNIMSHNSEVKITSFLNSDCGLSNFSLSFNKSCIMIKCQ